ncbi:MAG TPA: hypothetical protein GX693_04115 [Firmicutes bacterium]|nr:hypothetical protein [Bacillota bacterium]
MAENNLQAEHLIFKRSCHTVEEAAAAAGCTPHDLIKSICLVDGEGRLIVAIVKGEHRVSTSRVGKHLQIEPPEVATPQEIEQKTGYPCGGVPCFGYRALFLVDPRVMEKPVVYSGGGSPRSLVKICPPELLAANGGEVARVRS